MAEDLARRFITVELDPRTEDPEARQFTTDIQAEVIARRMELLAAAVTIWRWGRVATDLKRGLPLGSFGQWCVWVRDPLLALGCHDPAARVAEAKGRDERRQQIAEIFAKWFEKHKEEKPVAADDLHDDVKVLIDPQKRSRQYLVSCLLNLTGTRMAGFVLTRQAPAGIWGRATYALQKA